MKIKTVKCIDVSGRGKRLELNRLYPVTEVIAGYGGPFGYWILDNELEVFYSADRFEVVETEP